MKKELVIAAYDKDLSWINKLNKDVKITIYRKGTKSNNENEIFLEPNIGRCVHTFFNHILINYEKLSDYTFFVQDYPFDHWENIIEVINGNHIDFINESKLNIGGYFGYHWNSIGTMWSLSPSNHHNDGRVLICQSNGLPQDNNPNIDIDKYWRILFENEPPNNYEFIPGGHFGIKKEHANIRSKEFYQKIVNLLLDSEHTPWVIERLECYIFNPNYKTKY